MALLNRRQALLGALGVSGSCFMSSAGAQGGYPSGLRTIKVVIPFAAGGASDIIGRLLTESLTNRWRVPAALEFVPGASATIGMGRVAHGPKDGSQILVMSLNYITTQYIFETLPYDPEKDLMPLVQLTRQPNLLCVRKGLPVETVADLIAHAKANPGKLNYASSGVGSPIHLAAELFKRMTQTDMQHIPYSGSAPAKNDLIGGHVDVMFDNAASIIELARSGTVKALGITTATRSPLAPEFPAVAETVPGYTAGGWFGAAMSAGTPAGIQQAVSEACLDLLREDLTKDRLKSVISEPVGARGNDFRQFLSDERARWGALIRELGIKA
jgi:tripartite-type tricarboxylate transporter receptor subunit TctC